MSNTATWEPENDKAQVKRARGSEVRRVVNVNPITVVIDCLLENQLKDWALVLDLRNRCRIKQGAAICATTLCGKIVDQVDPQSNYRQFYPLDNLIVHEAVKLWAILLFRAGHEFVDQCRSKDSTAAMLVVLRSSEVDWPVKVNMARLVQTAVSRFRLREFGKVRAVIDDENLIDERQITPFEDTHHIFNPDLLTPHRHSRSERSHSDHSTTSHCESTDPASVLESQPFKPLTSMTLRAAMKFQDIARVVRTVEKEYLSSALYLTRRVVLLKKYLDETGEQPHDDHIQILKMSPLVLQALQGISKGSSPTEEEKIVLVNARMEMERCISHIKGLKTRGRPRELPEHKVPTQLLAPLVCATSFELAPLAKEGDLDMVKRYTELLSYHPRKGEDTSRDVASVPTKPENSIHGYGQSGPRSFDEMQWAPDFQKNPTLLTNPTGRWLSRDMYRLENVGFIIEPVNYVPHLLPGKRKQTSDRGGNFAESSSVFWGTPDDLRLPTRYQLHSIYPPTQVKECDLETISDCMTISTQRTASTWRTAMTSQNMHSFTNLSEYRTHGSFVEDSIASLTHFPDYEEDLTDRSIRGLQPKATTIYELYPISHLRIERSRIEFSKKLGSKLGKGGQGTVYQGTLHPTPSRPLDVNGDSRSAPVLDVAVKVLNCSNIDAPLRRTLMKEILTWSTLRHRNLLPFIGFCLTDGQGSEALILSPYQWRGSICKYIEKSGLPLIERLEKIVQTAAAVAYLHEQKVCHSDIKGENVLVGHDGNVLLGDFGLARTVQQSEGYLTTGHVLGTTRWSSPELLVEGVRNFPGDVWSWGCLFVEIIKAPTMTPYHDIPDRSVMAKIVVEKSRRWPYLPSELEEPMDLRSVVKPCWQWEPHERATIFECTENVLRLLDPKGPSAGLFKDWAWKHVTRIMLEAKQECLQYGNKGARCVWTCNEILSKIESEVVAKGLIAENLSGTQEIAARGALDDLRLLPIGVVEEPYTT